MLRRLLATGLALVSAFFVFYFVRLLVVTGGLRHVRASGGGAYAGAAVFPLIALLAGWVAVRLWRGASGGRRTA